MFRALAGNDVARRVFFSFHYQRDIVRASQVRNSWVTQERSTAGFWDSAAWEQVVKDGDASIKSWIERQLDGTSITVVLIGAETAERRYVIHEIQRSYDLRKGLLGIRINGLKNFQGNADYPGPNPFDRVWVESPRGRQYLSALCPLYDYVRDNGYSNMNAWIEAAAKAAGR